MTDYPTLTAKCRAVVGHEKGCGHGHRQDGPEDVRWVDCTCPPLPEHVLVAWVLGDEDPGKAPPIDDARAWRIRIAIIQAGEESLAAEIEIRNFWDHYEGSTTSERLIQCETGLFLALAEAGMIPKEGK